MKKKISICIIFLFLLLLCGCQRVAKEPVQEKNWYENVTPKGYLSQWSSVVIENEEFVYYASVSGIVRIDKTTREEKLIFENTSVVALDLDGDTLYYQLEKEGIFRYENGKSTRLWKKDVVDTFGRFKIYNGIGYLTDNLTIIKYDPETDVFESLEHIRDCYVPDFSSAGYFKNGVFYTDHAERTGTIYRKDLETDKIEMLRGKGKYKPQGNVFCYIAATRDHLFYSKRGPQEIYIYNEDGNDLLIHDVRKDHPGAYVDGLTTSGKDLYFLIDSENLYKYSPESGKTQQFEVPIDDVSPYDFKVVDGIYFYEDRSNNNIINSFKLVPVA